MASFASSLLSFLLSKLFDFYIFIARSECKNNFSSTAFSSFGFASVSYSNVVVSFCSSPTTSSLMVSVGGGKLDAILATELSKSRSLIESSMSVVVCATTARC